MRYFLTGATGFIGGVLARQLVEAGHEVIALVREPARATGLQALGVTLAPGDVTDKESMRAPMDGVDGVYHVAGWYKIGARDKSQGERVNVYGTRNVLELMEELHIPKGVYTSTLAVNSDTKGKLVDETYRFNGQHLSEYDRTKAVAHEIAVEFMGRGLPLVIVMPGLVYGPGDASKVHTMLVDYLKGRLPLIVSQTAHAWAHVEDVALAHRLAMEKGQPGESYIVCGNPYTVVEVLQFMSRTLGRPMPRVVSPAFSQNLARITGVLENFFPLPSMYTAESLRVVGGPTYLGSNQKARQVLGYAPRSLEEGLPPTLLYEMEQLGMEPILK